MYNRSCFLLLCIIIYLGSCNDFKRLSPRSKLIINTDKEFFRGLDFDTGIENVKAIEKARLAEEFTDYLRYRIDADSLGKKEYVEIEYFFNKANQLDLFLVFYALSQPADIQPLITELKAYFEKRYGKAVNDELGWYNWEFRDETGIPGTIEIKLVGEKDEGYLGVEIEMLKYYEFEERL